jgi:hypothetical protein
MNWWILGILLLVLVVLIVALVYIGDPKLIKVTGAFQSLDEQIMKTIKPLLKECGRSNVTKYLNVHFDKKGKKLDQLIEYAIDNYPIETPGDFILYSGLSYGAVCDRYGILCEPQKYIGVVSQHTMKIRRMLEKALEESDIYWEIDKLRTYSIELLTAHRLYRFKQGLGKLTKASLLKRLKRSPKDVLTPDEIAFVPIIQATVKYYKKASDKSTLPIKDLRDLRTIVDGMEELGYPYHKLRGIRTYRDLARMFAEGYFSSSLRVKQLKSGEQKLRDRIAELQTLVRQITDENERLNTQGKQTGNLERINQHLRQEINEIQQRLGQKDQGLNILMVQLRECEQKLQQLQQQQQDQDDQMLL